ncbi:MAG: threonyl-tRNA synthetase [Patescibacteria group bacterium]|nr:threonyl-tRNA synthetase [Patescibacteria group bacterium]
MNQENLQKNLSDKRHTLSHVLASVILEKYPTVKLTLGPAIDNGFYYDIDFGNESKLNGDEDLKEITKEMKKKINLGGTFSHKETGKDAAIEFFTDNEYKIELINEIAEKGEKITLYTIHFTNGETFVDLCRGGHIENLKDIDAESFKITHTAGAYWRGSEKNKMLTRVYGLAFDTKEELEKYEKQMEEAKKRDHRILGEKLDLFCFDENIGKGLPIWLPKGNIIKEELEKWAKETEEKMGYQRITTPIITKDNLFYTSGHLPLYKESMYAPIEIEGENYYIKPMNCPFHHRTFAARLRSYKELPLRLAEYGWCHRYEDSGSLFGMMRVRGMQMNDAHIYIQKENAVEEFINVIRLHEYYYKILGINKYEMELSLRDPNKMDKYHGNEEDWVDAENMTKEAMEKSGVPYKIVNEGAAFYGPKMDFQVYSSIGRSFSASTNQLDLYMGKAFNLEYVDKDGTRKTPAIIHRAPLGTHERFIGFLIEHFSGAFPIWLSPVQVVLISVKDSSDDYMRDLNQKLKEKSIRTEIFEGKEGMGKSVRYAKDMKYPYWIVIGDKEVAEGKVTLESRSGEKSSLSIDELIEKLKKEVEEKKID